MDDILRQRLRATVRGFGEAHILNLAAEEEAVTRGQFNLAKVLRATAHSQRVMAQNMARLLVADWDPTQVLVLDADALCSAATLDADAEVGEILGRVVSAGSAAEEIVRRSMDSLTRDRDVSENDVLQVIWGCYGCGYLVEGERGRMYVPSVAP